eukprot:CAMPEP_0171606852 /NCGR_PEP_ID=MMETSP0990-20121206/8006_1 /TAXON_ID=483369 /ORGANISM="non described non described, Strain CCMP2098" /LENGTH=70 /DNA_ID=CAMNT_0012169761 /DNA_START=266 /DNA_END=475 /DNA_ORIENTATION=-
MAVAKPSSLQVKESPTRPLEQRTLRTYHSADAAAVDSAVAVAVVVAAGFFAGAGERFGLRSSTAPAPFGA